MMGASEFTVLGQAVSVPGRKLEVFPTPGNVNRVVLESDEVTSLCPVTGQPDWETVRIEFAPGPYCVESKSLKLYFWSFRQEGAFCEALSGIIAQDIWDACRPKWVQVTVTQKPRGGITISATSRIPEGLS